MSRGPISNSARRLRLTSLAAIPLLTSILLVALCVALVPPASVAAGDAAPPDQGGKPGVAADKAEDFTTDLGVLEGVGRPRYGPHKALSALRADAVHIRRPRHLEHGFVSELLQGFVRRTVGNYYGVLSHGCSSPGISTILMQTGLPPTEPSFSIPSKAAVTFF